MAAARAAGLVWVSDAAPGYGRRRDGRVVDARGRLVRDADVIARVRRLVIPPAWTDVWICADPRGHLQATGRDAKGRKQYRYHPEWAEGRGLTKFDHLLAFGTALPRIRDRVARALAGVDGGRDPVPTRERVLATIVRLLDTTWLRIGNPEYARANRSYGLSTLRTHHAGVNGHEVVLRFTGKAGVRHEVRLEDRRVARLVRRCRELPGQELFQYVDGDGSVHRIGSADVNAWLAEASAAVGEPITAKDFRTWHGSVQALELVLAACTRCAADPTAPRCALPEVLKAVSRRLGNTVAVCRKAYVHPAVLALADAAAEPAGLLAQRWVGKPPLQRGLRVAERQLLGLLKAGARSATVRSRARAADLPAGRARRPR